MASQDFLHFLAAVNCLSTGKNFEKANKWLMKFKNMENVWPVVIQCLGAQQLPSMSEDSIDFAHFQAATMLKVKIQKTGEDLSPQARLQLRQKLVQFIKQYHSKGSNKVALQLCIALANLAVVDDTWKNVIIYCVQQFSELSQRQMLLDVLKYFPEQLHCHNHNTISIARLRALEAELRTYSPTVLKLVQQSIKVPQFVQHPNSLRVRLHAYVLFVRLYHNACESTMHQFLHVTVNRY